MVKGFGERWKEKEKDQTVVDKIKNVGKPSESLKDQITTVTQRLEMQTRTLDAAIQRFDMRGQNLFNRVVKAMSEHDEARANILASELAEVRKVQKMLNNASLALQSVSMRLSTVSEMGDLVTVLMPAKGVLNGIRTEMCGIMPEASQELGNIGNILSDIVVNTNQSTDVSINTGGANPEAMAILQEAQAAVQTRLEEQLPSLPSENRVQKRASAEASA